MKSEDFEKEHFDSAAYIEHLKAEHQAGRCWICELVSGPLDLPVIYRDDVCIAFFNRPRLLGYIFVAPIEHRTEVVDDFSEADYIELQRRVYRFGRAVSAAVPTERLYVLSFGAREGLAHVHWHLAPQPPDTPFDRQNFEAISQSFVLQIPERDQRALAATILEGVASS